MMTITAKNYAAQVERQCLNMADLVNQLPDSRIDRMELMGMAQTIQRAVHFALPDGGMLMDDDLRGLSGLPLRLPYPEITVEYFVSEKQSLHLEQKNNYSPKRLALVTEIVDLDRFHHPLFDTAFFVQKWRKLYGECPILVVQAFCTTAIYKNWMPTPIGIAIPAHGDFLLKKEGVQAMPIIVMPAMLKMFIEQTGLDQKAATQHLVNDNWGEVRAVLEMLEALSCSNVGTMPLAPVDTQKNARRLKAGKLPFYETRVLTLTPTTPNSRAAIVAAQSGRSGPRQHLRRGHIRRLSQDRRIWVNACVVGHAEQGSIEKNYQVAA